MVAGLLEDGWTALQGALTGWYVKQYEEKGGTRKQNFIGPNLQFFKNITLAQKHLAVHSSDSELGEFICQQVRAELQPDQLNWVDTSEVFPWRVARTALSGKLLLSPQGTLHTSFKAALDLVKKSTETNVDDFLSFLNKNFGYKPLKKVEQKAEVVMNEGASNKAAADECAGQSWEEDASCPPGWTSAAQDSQQKLGRQYKDPTGKYFRTRLEALRWMSRETGPEEAGFSQDDTDKMLAGLEQDGWSGKDLPQGWRLRITTKPGGQTVSTYLTPRLETLASLESVVRGMKEAELPETEISRVKEGHVMRWRSEQILPPGWMVSMQEEKPWLRRYLDPSGKFYPNLPAALAVLAGAGERETVGQLEPALQRDGWRQLEFLPAGCWLKQCSKGSNKGPGFVFLAPTFTSYKNARRFRGYLVEAGSGEAELGRFDRGFRELTETESMQLTDCERVLPRSCKDWEEDAALPAGWKVSVTATSHGEVRRYQSPAGHYHPSLNEAYRSLPVDGEDSQEREKFRAVLLSEGWAEADYLPAGWLLRTTKHCKTEWLTERGELLSTMGRVLAFMSQHSYTQVIPHCNTT